jgi:hypothetical protein
MSELSKKMTLMRRQAHSLVDMDDITAQVSTAKPVKFKSKGALQGKCCCQEHHNLASHINAQVKLVIYEKEAIEMVEVTQAEPKDEEQTDHGMEGVSLRKDLDIEAVPGTPVLKSSC